MIPDMSYFKTIHNASGTRHAKDAKVIEFQTRFARDFDSSINAVYDATRNDVQQDFIIVPTKAGCSITPRPGQELNIGDIIYYNGLHWLVTDRDFHDELTNSGDMVRCNRQIRWQNPDTYEIIERWCLVTKPYTSNIDEGNVLSTSNREFKVQLPYDEETKLLDLDKRFMLEIINGNPRTYKCTSVDQQTNKYQDIDGGFIVINLSQDESGQPDDRADLMICNYKDPPDIPEPSPTLLKCAITGRNNIRVGISRKYTAIFYADDGATTVGGVTPAWTVTAPEGYEDKVTWATNDGFIEITVTDETLIGQVVVVGLVDTDGLYAPVTIDVEVVDTI